jgi:N utilization substance protein B
MSARHDTRRLAMQLLYQIDLRGESDLEAIRQSLDDGIDPPEVSDEAFKLARAAWEQHGAADAMASELAPTWPTPRQPPVDRAILRLAYYEILSGHAPPKVVINEAVELSKEYCSQQSPPFINGVLDKIAKRLTASGPSPLGRGEGEGRESPGAPETTQPPAAPTPQPPFEDADAGENHG